MDTSRLTLDHFLSRFQLLRPQMTHETLNQRQAAVLIPVVRRPQPGLLLTQRAIHLRKHAGQVAFPAGPWTVPMLRLSPQRFAKRRRRSPSRHKPWK